MNERATRHESVEPAAYTYEDFIDPVKKSRGVTRRWFVGAGVATVATAALEVALKPFKISLFEAAAAERKKYAGNLEQQEARGAYERRLEGFAPTYPEVHKQQGRDVLVQQLMEPPIVGSEFEPTEAELEAMLGESKTGLIVVPSYHRALLYQQGDLVHEMPVGTGRHKNASEGKYYTPRGFFPVQDKIEVHWSKQTYNRAKRERKVNRRRSWNELKRELADMWHTLRLTIDGVATHRSNRFGKNGDGEETLLLDRSHGCINLRAEDAQLVYDTLGKGDTVAILDDIESRVLEIAAQDAEEALATQTAVHVQRIRAAEGTFDERMQQQPDVADLITQVRRYGEMPLFNNAAAASVIYAPLHRNPETKEKIFVNGVKVSDSSLLLVKHSRLRVFTPPQLLGNEARATEITVTPDMLQTEKEGALHGRPAFVASQEFEQGDGVLAEEAANLNALPTFLIDPIESPELADRIKKALHGHENETTLKTELENGDVLAGILRPDEFDAFLDKKGIDRGEPVFTKGGSSDDASLVGLVLEWLPLPTQDGSIMQNTEGQWGMVLISKPSATKRTIDNN